MLTFRWTALPNIVKEPIENDLSLGFCVSRLQVLKLSTPQTNVIHWVLQMYIFNTKTSMHNEDAILFCVVFRFLLENHLTLFEYLNVWIDDFELRKSQLENAKNFQQLNELEHSVCWTEKNVVLFSLLLRLFWICFSLLFSIENLCEPLPFNQTGHNELNRFECYPTVL